MNVTSPVEGAVVNTSAPIITGSIDAGTGVTGWGWIGGFYPQCTVDSLPIYNCNQMWGLAQGSHVLTVELRSYLTGLAVDGQSKTINFTVHDTSPPTLSSTQPASGGVISNGQGDISIVASPDAAAFSAPGLNCYLAGSYYMPSPNGVTEMFTLFYCTLADQTDGPRNIAYSLVDRAGNTASGNLIWTVSDPTAPSLEVESPVDAATYPSSTLAPDGTFDKGQGFGRANWLDTNYTESEARCSVDGATPTREQCQFVDHLSDGEHTFAVSIWDYWAETQMAGVGATLDFEVSDAVAPSILGTKPAAGSTITDVAANVMLYTSPDIETISVAGLSCPASGYRARRSSPDWPYRQPRTEFICKISGATNGAHVATYQMTDWAGNASSGSLNWTVDDITAPQIAITQPANGSTISSEEVQFSFEMYGDAEVSCQLDNQPLDCQEFVDTYGYLRGHFSHVALAGAHTFAVTATDSVGNSSTKASSFTVVPTTPSATSPFLIAAPEAGQTVATSALAVTARIHDRNGSAPAKNPFCRIDDGDWQSCERAIPLVPGAHQLDGKLVAGATHDSPTVPNTEKSVAFDALQDQTAPAITGVTDGMTVNNALQTIPVGASFDTQSLTAEGFTCAKSDYSFSQEWEFSTVTASNFLCTASQLSYGTENVTFNATDYADNTATIVRSITFALPTPSAQNPFVITTPYTGQTVTSSALAVSGQIYQRSGSTYKYPYCKLDDGEWQQCETVIPLSAGSHTLQTKLVEGWNSTGPIVPNSESTIPFIAAADVTAPVMTMANNMTIPDSSQTFVVGSSVDTDSVTAEGFTCSRNSYSTSYAAEYSTSIAANFYCRASQISNGTQSVTFTATDNAGNTGTMVRSITYNDLSAPTITNLSPADGSSKESRYTSFSFNVAGSVNTSCTLNGASENCSWGGMYSRTLDYGTHVWVIQASDAVGNSTTRMSTFQVADVTPPALSISSPAAGQTFASRFTIFYSASDTSGESLTYDCRIDTSAWGSCSSSQYTVYSSTNGPHEFFVRVTDLAGNETVRSVSFTVNDTQAPTIAIDNALNGATFDSSNVPNSTFSNDDPNAAIICKLDGIPYDCEGWSGTLYFYRAMANGPHTVELTATDWIGNQSTASATFVVDDTTAPEISLVSPHPGAVLLDGTNVTADFDVDSDEDFDFTCSLDGQAYSDDFAWSSSCEYPSLLNGEHTVSAKATDASGNATTLSVSFTVNDTVGPTITITEPVTQPYRFATNPRFYFNVEGEVGSASCSFDEQESSTCYSSYGGWSISQGDHELSVTAVDGAGNRTTLAVPFSFVDDVPPDISIASPADGAVMTSSPISPPSFSGNDQWNASRTCTVDGLPLGQNCNSNFVWQSLANGQHTLKLWASDSYGNTTFKQSTFTINDVTNESVTISYPSSGQIVTDSSAYFYFSVGMNYSGWYCRIDARSWSSCSGSFQPTRLKNGPHTFTVMKKDNGQRVASSTTSFTVADVTPPPSFSIANLSQGETLSLGDWRYINVTPYMSGGTEQCFLDGVSLFYCYVEAETVGPHTLRVVRSDPAGNTAESTVDFNVAGAGGGDEEPEEGEPLNLSVSDPLPGAMVPVSPMIRYTTNRAAVNRLYGWVDESEEKSRLRVTSTGWRPAAITEGAHTIHLEAVGFDGSVESLAIPVVVDDAEPSLVDITTPKPGATVTQSPARIRFTAGSDITSSECRVDGGAWFDCSPYYAIVPAGLANGSHTVEVRVTDFGGHVATDSRTFTIADSAPPEFQITSPTENQVLTENVSLNLDIAAGEGYATIRCELNGAPLDGTDDGVCSKKQWLRGFQPGANQLEVTLTDGVGNVATRVVNFTATSTTTQLIQILRPIEGETFTDSSYAAAYWVASELDGDRPTGDYNWSVQCNVDDGGWSYTCPDTRYLGAPGLPMDYYRRLAGSNGPHSLGIRLTDFLGNSSVASVNYSVDDHAPPVFEVDDPASGATYADGNIPLTLDGEGIIDFECSLDEAVDFTPCVGSQSYGYWADQLPLAAGSHELRIRATDPAGNESMVVRSFAVASSGASVTIDGPSGFTNDVTPTFSVSSEPADLEIECRIDSSPWSDVASSYTTDSLADGTHVLSCRAMLANGGVSAPSNRTFTVDTVPPNTNFANEPDPLTNDSTPSFTLSSPDAPGGSYECRVDAGDWETRTIAVTVEPLGDGQHTIECRAIDAATNVDGSPARFTFVVDTIAPTTTITGATLTNDVTPTFALSVNESVLQTQCSLADSGWQFVTSSYTAPLQTEGEKQLTCRSTDLAGNAEAGAVHAITIDTTPPETNFSSVSPAVTAVNALFATPQSTEAGSILRCRVDSGLYQVVTGTYITPALSDGLRNIRCYATDPAGNADASPATSETLIDTQAPTITWMTLTNFDWVADSTPDLGFELNDLTEVEAVCALDDGPELPCVDGFDSGVLPDGPHALHVAAIDELDHLLSTTLQFWIDTVPPQTTASAAPGAPTNNPGGTLGLGTNEAAATIECRTDAGEWGTRRAVLDEQEFTQGLHTYECRAIDLAGNVDPTPVASSFFFDSSAPFVEITYPSQGAVTASSFEAEFTATDNLTLTLECKLDEQVSPCTNPLPITGLGDGNHIFEVVAIDAAGNIAGDEVTFVVDSSAPETSWLTLPATPTSSRQPQFRAASSEGGSIQCRADGGEWSTVQLLYSPSPLTDGAHAVECRAVDLAGNVDATPLRFEFDIDATGPGTTISSPDEGEEVLATKATIEFTTTDPHGTDGTECRVDDGEFSPCDSPFVTPVLEDGAHSVTIRAADTLGNASETVRGFSIKGPQVTAKAGDDVVVRPGDSVTFDATATASNAPVDLYEWDFGDGENATGASVAHVFDAIGEYTVTLRTHVGDRVATDTLKVSVVHPVGGGVTVTINVDGSPADAADVAVILADGRRFAATTGPDGRAVLSGLPDGSHSVMAQKQGAVPGSANVMVENGAGEAVVNLASGAVASSVATNERLNRDEIVANGIDPDDPDNQNVFEFEIHLAIGSRNLSLDGFWITGEGGGRWIPGWDSSEVGCTFYAAYADCGWRAYPSITWHTSGSGELYPTMTFMIIPGKAKFLKEFFEITYVVSNLAPAGFDFTPGTAKLNLPDGLSLAPTSTPQSLVNAMPQIPGGSSASTRWVVRGDEEGEYSPTLDYGSTLQPFGTPVTSQATVSNPLKVWGGSALEMIVDTDNEVVVGDPMQVRVGLKNVSDIDVYNASVELLKDGKFGYIYQPRERLEQSIDTLPPGQTFWADYLLVPYLDGWVLPQHSFVKKTAGNVELASSFKTHERILPEDMSAKKFTTDDGYKVLLDWDPVPGATEYKVYATDERDIDFGDAPETPRFEYNDGQPLSSDGTKAIIEGGPPNETRFFAVSPLVNGRPMMRHPMMRSIDSGSASPTVNASAGSCGETGFVGLKLDFEDQDFGLRSYSDLRVDGELVEPAGGTLSGTAESRTVTVHNEDPYGFDVSVTATNADGDVTEYEEHVGGCRYVSLGDSYSSGEGVEPFTADTLDDEGLPYKGCHRSQKSYAAVLHQRAVDKNAEFSIPGVGSTLFRACSGGVIEDVNGIIGSGLLPAATAPGAADPQVPYDLEPQENVKLVTMSIGGNDLDFASIVRNCVVSGAYSLVTLQVPINPICSLVSSVPTAVGQQNIKPKLVTLYKTLREKFPKARIVILGYPQIFPVVDTGGVIPGYCAPFNVTDLVWMHGAIAKTNTVIEEAAREVDPSGSIINYAPMGGFDGHDVCKSAGLVNDDERYFNGIVPSPRVYSFHPNEKGQRQMADDVLETLDGEPQYPGTGNFLMKTGEFVSRATQVPAGAVGAAWNAVWPGSDVDLEITSPSGVVYTASSPGAGTYTEKPTEDRFEIANPEPGEWSVRILAVEMDPDGEQVRFGFTAPGDPNEAPYAIGKTNLAEESEPTAPFNVAFDGSASFDADGSIDTLVWEFGDGAVAQGETTAHTYANPGTYTPKLTVTDNDGTSSSTLLSPIEVKRTTQTAPPDPPNGPSGPSAPVQPIPKALFGSLAPLKSVSLKKLGSSRGVSLKLLGVVTGARVKISLMSSKPKLLVSEALVTAKSDGDLVLKLKLSKKAKKQLKKLRRVKKLRMTIAARKSGAQSKTTTASVSLVR